MKEFKAYESIYEYKVFIDASYETFKRQLTISEIRSDEIWLQYDKFKRSLKSYSEQVEVAVMCEAFEKINFSDGLTAMFMKSKIDIMCSDVKALRKSYPMSLKIMMLRYFLSKKYPDKKVQFALFPW